MKIIEVTIDRRFQRYFEEEILVKANKKLARVNQSSLRVLSIDKRVSNSTDEYGREVTCTYLEYKIECPEITGLTGVEYIGTISYKTGIKTTYTEEDSIVLSDIPQYRLNCDHCKVNRYRNIYHVFRKNGKLMVIGSACAKDYFGHDIGRLLNIMDFVRMPIDEDSFGSWGGKPTWYVAHLVLPVLFATKHAEKNWIGRKRADETGVQSTSYAVREFVNPSAQFQQTFEYADYKAFVQEHHIEVNDIVERLYTRWEGVTTKNDFEANIYNQLFEDDGDRRQWCASIGIIGYAIYAILKDEIDAKAKAAEESVPQLPSHFQGAIKERLDLNVTVTFKLWIENDWGGCELVKMADDQGNVYTTFASASSSFNVELNETYHIKGTVKKHDAYKGIKQTILNRCTEVA